MKVKLRRRGILLSVETLNTKICGILERALCYDHFRQLRGNEAREKDRNFDLTSVQCYQYQVDPDGVLPTTLVTAAGYLQLIVTELRKAGYTPVMADTTPQKHPDMFKVLWDRLSGIELRWKQDYVLRQMEKHYLGRLDLVPGYGKGLLIAAHCRALPRPRIDIATHATEVAEQLYFEISKHCPSVGLQTGKHKRTGERIMVYSGKSLHKADGNADELLIDECHEWGTDDYMERLGKYTHARRYGFSANHEDRSDGADFEILGALGPVIAVVEYPEAVEHGCVVPIEVHIRDVITDMNPVEGLVNQVARERHGIWQNHFRNSMIAEDAMEDAKHGQVLISVKTIEHAVYLKSYLPDFALCYAEGGMDEQDRERYIALGLIKSTEPRMTTERRFKLKRAFETGKLTKVIANTVWKRGVNFRQLPVLIRADAESSMISDTQIPGRVSRIFDNKQVGIVRDYADQFDEGFNKRAAKRAGHYKQIGWTVVRPNRGRMAIYRQRTFA